MTPAARLRAALDALGWSQRELARRLVQDERTVRRWASGEHPCPEAVLAWLEALAAVYETMPPPRSRPG